MMPFAKVAFGCWIEAIGFSHLRTSKHFLTFFQQAANALHADNYCNWAIEQRFSKEMLVDPAAVKPKADFASGDVESVRSRHQWSRVLIRVQ
jgi:hypothetical protein